VSPRLRVRTVRVRAHGWALQLAITPAWVNPFETFVAGLCVLSGVTLLAGGPRPASLESLLPAWLVVAWACMLVVGGGLVGLGLSLRRVLWETVGLQLLAPASGAYSLAILTVTGWGGLAAASPLLGFGLACAARIYSLRLLHRLTRAALDA
jgi:hypothetical protein